MRGIAGFRSLVAQSIEGRGCSCLRQGAHAVLSNRRLIGGDASMSGRLRFAKLLLLILSLASCVSESPSAPATPTDRPLPVAATESPTEPPTATVTPVVPTRTATTTAQPATAVEEGCEIAADGDVTVYNRPSADALVFGTMEAGSSVPAEGRTREGWLGFEPGVAQAANVGVFRLRWVKRDEGVRLVGACEDLPTLDGPPAGICFTMPMTETRVHADADENSAVIASMDWGEYASVVARAEGWARVDLSVGNTGREESGWVREDTLNLNGPCENLPVVEP